MQSLFQEPLFKHRAINVSKVNKLIVNSAR
jgi:hypothetical protein